MAQAGSHTITQHLAMELADDNIQINTIALTVVNTSIDGAYIEPDEVDEALKGFHSCYPIGRIGTADDVAQTITFLLSEQAGWAVDDEVMAGRN